VKNNPSINFREIALLFIVSVTSSLFAYALVYFLSNFTALYFAYDFDIPAHFDLYKLYLDKSNAHWTHDATITILLSRPIASLFIGILALSAVLFIRKKLMSFFFFLLWVNLLAFNSAAGIFVDNIITKSDTYDVTKLMNFDMGVMVLLSIVVVYFLFRLGTINLYVLQASFPRRYFDNLKNRMLFLFTIIILPWLFMFLLPLFNTADNYQFITLLKNMSMIFILAPLFVSKPAEHKFNSAGNLSPVSKYDAMNMILFALGAWLLAYFMVDGVYLWG